MTDSILSPVLTQILQALAIAIAGFVVMLLKRLVSKLGIDLDNKQEAQLESYARQAALWVEEEAARRLKLNAEPMTPQEKASIGLTKMLSWAPVGSDPVAAADKLKAVLPTLGLGAAGKVSGAPSI